MVEENEEDYTPSILEEEIVSEIDGLKSLPLGSPESKIATENVATLISSQNDICRGNTEYEQQERKLRIEEERLEMEKKAANTDIIKFIVGTITGAVTTAFTFGMYGHWYNKGLNFDQDNIMTSPTAKDLVRNKPNIFRIKK